MIRDLIKSVTGAKPEDLRRAAIISVLAAIACAVMPAAAMAQSAVNINLGTGAGLTDRVVQLVALMTVLSLAPSIVIMTTSFVRIVVVLGLLRTAIGIQSSPPNPVIISLALFLTAIVMGPTFERSYDAGIKPLLDHQMELPEAFDQASGPVKQFMLRQVDRDDLALFVRLSKTPQTQNAQALPMKVVTPAFMISELKRAFEIGFLLFIPFLVIDLVVASVLMSMGMMMLPPATISLPFKLIFFVLVDGWRLVAGSLVESFQRGGGG
ncbi:flagellar type III secretion system pore protein FliP [Caulobacter sp. RL271]|jgi:flagellar biosynthetic protein FliP|uniref:Flagellar biosynthetic protein FliP n=1 Tax=Caulobacter segnis TaxID=88688 RepID=A0ABY4ZWJ3_9CAUL|nr:flagellar type III secretion system pore protein FliP [Caulobacter segnis]USQ97192.1 flagellar type III secretion system pore protein FliP [Caulobacter segnis]